MSSLYVCQLFSLSVVFVPGGAGSGKGAGDEKMGSVRNPGQRGDLPQPPGGTFDRMCTTYNSTQTSAYTKKDAEV